MLLSSKEIREMIDKGLLVQGIIDPDVQVQQAGVDLSAAKVFKLDNTLIEEISSDQLKQKAPRPINSTFNLNKLSNALDWLPGGLDESLKKLKSQLE